MSTHSHPFQRTPGFDVGNGGVLRLLIVGACFLAAVLVGFLAAVDSRLLVAPAAPFAVFGLVRSPFFRLMFITFGGILILQRSDGIDIPKIAYLAGTGLCLALGTLGFIRPASGILSRTARTITSWTVLWLIVIAVSFFVAASRNVPLVDWLRGSIPYLLFAAVPLVVIDVARTRTSVLEYDWLRTSFVFAGVLTSLSWAIAWTTLRGIGDFGIDSLFLASFAMSAAVVCFSFSSAIHGAHNRFAWALLAFGITFLFVITGTRQSVLFLLPMLFFIVTSGRSAVKKVGRFVPPMVFSVLAIVGTVPLLSRSVDLDLGFVYQRFTSISEITGSSTAGTSYRERLQQTGLAIDAFWSSPWVGVSPGHRFEWNTEYGAFKSSFNIDSPMALLANFGLLGAVAAILSVVTAWQFVGVLEKSSSAMKVEVDAFRAFIVMMLVYVLAGSPFEDKGLSFAFIFLLSLTLSKAMRSPASLGAIYGPISGKDEAPQS